MTAARAVEPDGRDYNKALLHFALGVSFEVLTELATRIAADRIACEALAKAHALIATTPRNETRFEYLARQDEITRLFAEHERLMNIAYPETSNADE